MFIALLALLSVFQMITSLGFSHSFTLIKRQNEIHYQCGFACLHHVPSHMCTYTHLTTYPFLIASLILNECDVYYIMCWLRRWMLSCILARCYYFPFCLSWFFASFLTFSLAHLPHDCCCSHSFILFFFFFFFLFGTQQQCWLRSCFGWPRHWMRECLVRQTFGWLFWLGFLAGWMGPWLTTKWRRLLCGRQNVWLGDWATARATDWLARPLVYWINEYLSGELNGYQTV